MNVTLIKSGESYFKLSGVNESLFNTYNTDDGEFIYDPQNSLDDNQVYYIEGFSQKRYCPEILTQQCGTSDYDEFISNQSKDYLLNIVENKLYFFQRITAAMIKPKKYLRLLEDRTKYEKVPQGTSITIHDYADAIYNKEEDRLYFLKLEHIKSIFKGIEELYRMATVTEVDHFLESDFITLVEGFTSDDVKTNNRKRIALLKDRYSQYTNVQKKELREYIQQYEGDLEITNDTFVIKNDSDLKKMLYGIDQRYYTTPIEGEKRLANSIIRI
ncbi:Kiwa anti-phage protein KwaB-like domain-containing protein [Latilactobacillus sakei]|uniref:Kiwa anti-phage protein KwaB-like domain-containing protein n=1 Tax=Latilactobacillus sakei TaxID=1599 RepID=UPI0039AF7EAD